MNYELKYTSDIQELIDYLNSLEDKDINTTNENKFITDTVYNDLLSITDSSDRLHKLIQILGLDDWTILLDVDITKFNNDSYVVSYKRYDRFEIDNHRKNSFVLRGESTIPKENWGVHESHCCKRHGCKYGDIDCPVSMGITEQSYIQCYVGSDLNQDCKSTPAMDLKAKHDFLNLRYKELKTNSNTDEEVYSVILKEFEKKYNTDYFDDYDF